MNFKNGDMRPALLSWSRAELSIRKAKLSGIPQATHLKRKIFSLSTKTIDKSGQIP